MNEKHEKTEYILQQEGSTYQTGSTKPPKSYRGLILFLLGVVIFLGGIATALGLTNLQLFQALSAQKESTPNAVDFSHIQEQAAAASSRQTGLGFSGETVSEFWHNYHGMPRGIFIQSVDTGSDAALQGVLPGDILIRVNDSPVTSIEQLQTLLESAHTEQVKVVIYRDDVEIPLILSVVTPSE